MNKITMLFLLLIFAFRPAFGQSGMPPLLPLKAILSDIEKQHSVRFNYLDDAVSGYRIIPPDKALSLEGKLAYLSKNTLLSFEFIDGNSISISEMNQKIPEETAGANPLALQEILVPNFLAKGISKKTDGSYAISPQKFGILPGLTEADVLQTMQQIPGIMSVDETISNINVRGGTHDQNYFSWNGIRMFQTGHFFGLISAFNPLLTREIRIYKNGTSAFFGEGVSSTVAIATDPGFLEKSAMGFSVDGISGAFFAKIKASETASFVISGRRSFTDLLETPTYQNYSRRIFQNTVITNVENNENVRYSSDVDFYFYDLSLQYRQKIGTRHELTLNGIAISNGLDIDQSMTISGTQNTKSSNLEQQNYGGNLVWKTDWNPKNTTIANAYASRYNLDATNRSVASDQVLSQQNTVFETGLRLENTHILSPHFRLSNGYQYSETGIANHDDVNIPAFSRKIKNVLRAHAVVVETQLASANEKVLLKTGLRLNYFEKFNVFLAEPRIIFSYAFSKSLSAELSGEMKSQTASQIIDLQQDFLGLEKRRWTLADNDQHPIQKNRQLSIGLTYRKNGWLLTMDHFYKKVSGISSSSQAFQNQLEFSKLKGDYTVLGSEVLLQKNFPKFYTWIGYSFNNNNYDFDQNIPRRFSNNFEIVQTLSWAGIYEWKKLKLALGSKWNTGHPETTPKSSILAPANPLIDYNQPNNTILPDYFQVNFSAFYQWELPKGHLQLGLSILNVLDKRNIINRYYRVNAADNSVERVNTYSLERTPNISLKVTF